MRPHLWALIAEEARGVGGRGGRGGGGIGTSLACQPECRMFSSLQRLADRGLNDNSVVEVGPVILMPSLR